MTDNSSTELRDTLVNSLTETSELVEEISDRLLNCANSLRVEPSSQTFTAISEGIDNLKRLMDYVKELKRALEHIQLQGHAVSLDPLLCWDNSLDLFKEMLAAFENKDWITLCDIIQYELQPILADGKKGLIEINDMLQKI